MSAGILSGRQSYIHYAVSFIFTFTFSLCAMQQSPGYGQRCTYQGLRTMTTIAGSSIIRP